ncbi:MAG TPA: hypothetical protein VF032_01130 [Thermoleophilaceae bacterium]
MIADRGEHEPVPIFLEKGGEEDSYSFRLGLRAGIGGHDTARIPVGKRINPDPHPVLKEIHHCEVAGRVLEAANVYALREKVAQLLDSIAPSRSLPLAYFRVPAMDYVVPVYEDDGHIVSPVIGGPNLKSRDLAGIRSEVCRYLVSTGYVNDAEEVTVGVLRPSDLSLVAPAAIIRSLADPAMWIPTVEGTSAEGPVVGVLGHAAQLRPAERRRAGAGPAAQDTAPAAPEVISLIRFVRAELERMRSNTDPDALYACEVRPEIWAAAECRTEDAGSRLVAYLDDGESTRLELNVRRTGAGDVAVALEDRHINVFLAHGENALARQVGSYLAAAGFLRFADEVEIHAAAAPRAERLETDSIWTHPEEVHSTWS